MTDPLPPSAALPLREGENTLLDSDGFNVPLTEGDERERHCRERRGSLTTTFCAKPHSRIPSFPTQSFTPKINSAIVLTT